MREYLVRAAAVLGAIGVLFVLSRWAVGPDLLDVVHFDRAPSLQENASRPLQYLEVENCAGCHGARVETWQRSAHQGVSCESCHGPAVGHPEGGVSLAVEEPRALCILCHAALAARPASHPQVDVQEHAGPVGCTVCHSPHDPNLGSSARPASTASPPGAAATVLPLDTGVSAGPPPVPHAREGRSECTACHGPEGIRPFPADHSGRPSDICLACHQRGG